MQIYSFTPILMKFCTLDLQNKKKITVYFNFTKTNPYYHFHHNSGIKEIICESDQTTIFIGCKGVSTLHIRMVWEFMYLLK
jgi:hypothetical protein